MVSRLVNSTYHVNADAIAKLGDLVKGKDTGAYFIMIDSTQGVALMSVVEPNGYTVRAGKLYNVLTGNGYIVLPNGTQLLLEQM